jgi:hypothetical protein
VLIDLDTEQPARPSPARSRRVRFLPAAAGLVLVLAAGGAAPGAKGPAEVASIGARTTSAVVLTGDGVYSAHPGGTIRAEPLRAGGPRWTVRLKAREPQIYLRGPWLVVSISEGGVALLEPRTGQVRWQLTPTENVRVLGARVAVGDAGGLRVIDPVSGRTIWSRPDLTGPFDAEGDYLVAISGGNRATVLAAADGRVVAGPAEVDAGNLLTPLARIVGDTLVLSGDAVVDAYRLTDLTWLWRRTSRGMRDVRACGAWLCASGFRGFFLLDPRTGAERWSDPRWRTVRDDGIASDLNTRTVRLDLNTGRVLEDLGTGGPVGDLMLRTERDRTLVIRLADGRLLASLPEVPPFGCAREGVHLACPTTTGVAAWRIR